MTTTPSTGATRSAVAAAAGPLAPLGVTIFRWLWISDVVSNIGGWMQTVGAQWFLVEQNASPAVIALVSTAAAAPVLLFGIPAGVLGEFANKRHLLIGVQSAQALTAAVLAVLTATGSMTPSLLLAFTFALGVASAVQLPAYQAFVPGVVPKPLIGSAASLTSIGVNVARAIGPAVAGVVIASWGIPFVFALNAASFAGLLLVLVLYRGYTAPAADHERFIAATRAGLRYVVHAGVVRRICVQLLVFIVPANALWALLPVLASGRLGLDSNGYGILLAALGVGSIGGAFIVPRAKAALGTNRLVIVTSVSYGVGIAVAAFSPWLWLTLPVLVLVGLSWIGVIATLNSTVQSFLPGWVRTRGLSVYQLVLFGGTALGAAGIGALGGVFGTAPTMAGAGGVVVLGAALLLLWPLHSTADKSRAPLPMPLPEGDLQEVDPAGSTLVIVRYEVADVDRAAFLEAMRTVEQSRRRTGARSWNIYDDREHPGSLIEVFDVGTWREHLSQHRTRTTGYDAEIVEAARRLSQSEPIVEHLVAVTPPRRTPTKGPHHDR
ncbi:MFS transporter [Herbiconiux sp. P15]|uniref:MFS transporter n=1 Tax=Herbiconiux liukaitaii TaxID=3342799 RepID=UPI0035B950E2